MPARIVDKTIDASVFFNRFVDQTFDLVHFRNVAFDECSLALAKCVQLGSQRIALVLFPRTKNNLRSGVDKNPHTPFANAFRTACDDNDFIFISHEFFLNLTACPRIVYCHPSFQLPLASASGAINQKITALAKLAKFSDPYLLQPKPT
jgi:hypothetical protein